VSHLRVVLPGKGEGHLPSSDPAKEAVRWDALEGLILDAEDQGKAATVRRPAEIDDVNLVVADMRFKSVAGLLGLGLWSNR